MFPAQPSAPISVSQLNRQVKQLLETQYPAIPVQGEISTLSRPASGHLYFTLKDQNAQIRCAMFKGSLARNRYVPKQGDEVIAIGRLSLYEGRGDYQLIVNQMQPVGEGALQAAFFRLKEQLEKEGLFAAERKKPIPEQVRTVGVVTSGTGAAFHDILTVLQRRFPAMKVILYPTAVQGDEATSTIVQAIETANIRNEVDALIVGRGGGSLEDLWCFNTEAVARAIYDSALPVIAAVGHEVDVSIADFVADQRAATPSQAAEMISPDQFDLMQKLDSKEQQLLRTLSTYLSRQRQQIQHLRQRLKSPADTLHQWHSNLDALTQRLFRATGQPLVARQQQLAHLRKRLQQVNPEKQLLDQNNKLNLLDKRLSIALSMALEKKRMMFQKSVAKLNLLSPLATLERGYSITRKADASVIHCSDQIQAGDTIETILQSGRIESTVKRVIE